MICTCFQRLAGPRTHLRVILAPAVRSIRVCPLYPLDHKAFRVRQIRRPAGTGRVTITRPDGTVYDAAGFAQADDSGLKDKVLPKGDYILTIGGNYEDEGVPYLTIQVDGAKTFRANLDRRNSYDPLFYMFRYHITEAEYGPHTTPWSASIPTP